MEFWNRLSDRNRLMIIGILLIVFAWFGIQMMQKRNSQSDDIVVISPPAKLTVYVAGAVKKPGVYTLRSGNRIKDAITVAGGPASNWDPLAVNLAQHLEDEEMIVVPKQGASQHLSSDSRPKSKTTGPVRLNRASALDLEKLPGIGPGMAKRIIDFRAAHGPFRSIDGLRSVPGIGDKKLQRMKPFLQL